MIYYNKTFESFGTGLHIYIHKIKMKTSRIMAFRDKNLARNYVLGYILKQYVDSELSRVFIGIPALSTCAMANIASIIAKKLSVPPSNHQGDVQGFIQNVGL